MTALKVNLNAPAMLTGPAILLRPILAVKYGLNDAIVYSQLAYRSESSTIKHGHHNAVRFSYTRMQKQMPFFSRRSIISIVSRLEKKGAIQVIRDKRVNKIVVHDHLLDFDLTEQNIASLLVFPELAKAIGVNEAIVLQQIHIRHHHEHGRHWVIKPYHRWQSDVLMFMSIGVVIRTFLKLKNMGLIYVKSYSSDEGVTNAYRVNYLKVVEVLDLHIPDPKVSKAKDWINPLYPKLKNIK